MATVIVVILVGRILLLRFYQHMGARGDRRQERRRRLREQAAQLDAHHAIRWHHSPVHLRGRVEGWPTAANAMHTLCREDPVDAFRFSDPQHEARMLWNSWSIESSAGLRSQLLSLLRHGHRERFDAERRYWAAARGAELRRIRRAMRDAAGRDTDAAEDYLRFQNVRKNTGDPMSIDFLAWDLVRVIMLCRAGLTAGFIDENEAVDTALIASHGLRERFASWEDMGNHFHRGRWYWASEDGIDEALSVQHNEHAQRVLSTDPNSPWKAVPWETPLPAPTYVILDHEPAAPPHPDGVVDGEWRLRLEQEIGVRAAAAS